MGSINSKSPGKQVNSNRFYTKTPSRYSSFSRPQSFLSGYTQKSSSSCAQPFNNKRRSCLKRKVLMLGLDGVGKTDLFTRLISDEKQGLKIDSLPQPTLGKFRSKN